MSVGDDKIVEYLSKEIETHTGALVTFRSRVNMSVFVGPFILLGSALVTFKGLPAMRPMDCGAYLSIIGIVLSYGTMGAACAGTEQHTWNQCNMWRRTIASLCEGRKQKDLDFTFSHSLAKGYLVSYGAMLFAFGCCLKLLTYLVPGKG